MGIHNLTLNHLVPKKGLDWWRYAAHENTITVRSRMS